MDLKFEYFDKLDSTNLEIKRRLLASAETAGQMQGGLLNALPTGRMLDRPATALSEGLVVSAGQQTAGRDRSGHDWQSLPGVSIATSLLLFPELPPEKVARITILAGAAAAETVESWTGLPAQIKWPNDVLLNRKKICGILVEYLAEHRAAVVGIGINLKAGAYSEDLRGRATSLEEAMAEQAARTMQNMDAEAMVRQLWQCFTGHYMEFLENQGELGGLIPEVNRRLVNVGKQVRVLERDGTLRLSGIAEGVDGQGRLLVGSKDELFLVDSGEVSVRGLDGYV